MVPTVPSLSHRTHPKSRRTGLDDVRAGRANLRIDSDAVRNAPTGDIKGEFLALIDEARANVRLSKEAMAITAGCQVSALSEALSGTRGNFAAHWLWAQDDRFLDELTRLVRERRGLTEESTRALAAARIGELVRLLVEVA